MIINYVLIDYQHPNIAIVAIAIVVAEDDTGRLGGSGGREDNQ